MTGTSELLLLFCFCFCSIIFFFSHQTRRADCPGWEMRLLMVWNGEPYSRVGHYPVFAILMVIIAIGRRTVCHGGQRLGQVTCKMRLEILHSTGRPRAERCRIVSFGRFSWP